MKSQLEAMAFSFYKRQFIDNRYRVTVWGNKFGFMKCQLKRERKKERKLPTITTFKISNILRENKTNFTIKNKLFYLFK